MTIAPLISTQELAEAWQISPNAVRALVSNEGLPAVRIGRRLRFKPAEVDGWLNSQRPTPMEAAEILFPDFYAEASR